MSTHIQFHDKIRKILNICYLELSKNFVGTQKRVRISHDKRAIGVRTIAVRLYAFTRTGRTNSLYGFSFVTRNHELHSIWP